jgi:hypothetical protein
MNVAIACYGDGAANQGQIWEAANMANLWKLVRKVQFSCLLPCVLLGSSQVVAGGKGSNT